ncbi:hypothetical protein ABZ896_17000 [Streptomyces sp. NPDC047072]|uniref:hypothetical protein n=1 Tax=Streptomyces sp. NPDC047072 TaxID=3154809 RepID=UPI0033FA1844
MKSSVIENADNLFQMLISSGAVEKNATGESSIYRISKEIDGRRVVLEYSIQPYPGDREGGDAHLLSEGLLDLRYEQVSSDEELSRSVKEAVQYFEAISQGKARVRKRRLLGVPVGKVLEIDR